MPREATSHTQQYLSQAVDVHPASLSALAEVHGRAHQQDIGHAVPIDVHRGDLTPIVRAYLRHRDGERAVGLGGGEASPGRSRGTNDSLPLGIWGAELGGPPLPVPRTPPPPRSGLAPSVCPSFPSFPPQPFPSSLFFLSIVQFYQLSFILFVMDALEWQKMNI